MTIKYVEVKNGIVVSGPWSADIIPDLNGTGVVPIDVTSVDPIPQEYWTYSNETFTEGFPPLPPNISVDKIRAERNQLLKETDWRDLPSYPGSDQEAWREYRQALRDLPDGYVPVANPVFPEPPNS